MAIKDELLSKKAWGCWVLLAVLGAVIVVGLTGCSAPRIPASHYTNGVLQSSYNACSDCHQAGTNNAPKEPASHSKYADDQCIKCHKPAS